MISDKKNQENIRRVKKILEKQHYALVGNTSAVQICHWTKTSLNGKGVCWKEKFYGIKSHRCCQMSPAVMWCENQCLHCWRPIENNLGMKLPAIDDPKDIIEDIIKARKKLLIGFKGNTNVPKKKLEEAFNPTLFTLSLSGEATIYPRLAELIQEIKNRKAICFLVTNGLNPEKIKELEEKNSLPTQIAVSMNAPNKKLFKIWHRSKKKNAWKKFNQTLELLGKLRGKTRRVVRLTLVRKVKGKKIFSKLSNMESENLREYAKLIKKVNPNFVHVKGFMSIGYSRKRLPYEKQPWDYEVKKFAEELVEELKKNGMKGYKILGEEKRSCVFIIGKNKKNMRIKNL